MCHCGNVERIEENRVVSQRSLEDVFRKKNGMMGIPMFINMK
jgi:hypothetical protein